jgi:hypothetical protein
MLHKIAAVILITFAVNVAVGSTTGARRVRFVREETEVTLSE